MKRATINRIYVPKFSNNRDLEENDQVTVELDLATIKEKDIYAAMTYLKKGKMKYVKKEYTALREKTKSINNYYDDKNNPIDTAEKLIADMKAGSPESGELSEELWDRIMGYDKIEDEFGEETDEVDEDIDSSESGESLTMGES